MKKKVDLNAVLGDTVAAKGSRITDNLTDSMLNTKQVIKVSLSKIYVSKQIRLKIHQSTVDGIVKSYQIKGLHNLVEIRKVTPAIDENTVPEGYDYVLLAGEHRFRALELLGIAEHDFSYIPPSIIKTKEDVITYQYSENNVRSDMHLVEKANTLAKYLELGVSQTQAAEKMGITAPLASRLNRINKFLTEDDKFSVIELQIKSERVILGIAKLIELGHADWLSVIRPYALDEQGEFDPELIYEKTLNQIIKDLTAPPESEAESQAEPDPIQETQPETEETATHDQDTSKPLADDIVPNAFKEEAEPQQTAPTAQTTATKPIQTSYDNEYEDDSEAEEESQHDPAVQQQSSTPSVDSPTPLTPTTTSPASKGDDKEASLKLAANVLQQILSGKEVEEILIELGPDLKKYVSKEETPDIYEMIQTLPFSEAKV